MLTKQKILIGIMLVTALMVGVFLGSQKFNASKPPYTTSPEAGFARDMSIHHQQAIEMSFLVRDRTDNEAVRNFAYDIINTQAAQRGMLLGWLDLWSLPATTSETPMQWMQIGMKGMMPSFTPGAVMPGMATKEEMDQLINATGQEAEKLFLELMIRHHEGGVMMARGLINLSNHPQTARLAQTIVDGQQSEIKYMQQLLEQYE